MGREIFFAQKSVSLCFSTKHRIGELIVLCTNYERTFEEEELRSGNIY